MAAQREVVRMVSSSLVGRTLKVLVERAARAKELQNVRINSWEHGLVRDGGTQKSQFRGRYGVARSENDAPDIDGRVYVQGGLPVGQFARVRITGHTDYDLVAEPV
jgi:ribosomal protein S12 methylthiotransferase